MVADGAALWAREAMSVWGFEVAKTPRSTFSCTGGCPQNFAEVWSPLRDSGSCAGRPETGAGKLTRRISGSSELFPRRHAAFSKKRSCWSGHFRRRPCGSSPGQPSSKGVKGRVFAVSARISKAPPLNSSGGSAPATWPAPKTTRPMDPSWMVFLEPRLLIGLSLSGS